MSINKLPNECLYMILDHFNGFEELIRLSKVSPRWFLVVSLKLSKVKYLQLMDRYKRAQDYIEHNKLWKNTTETLKSHNLSDLFPNLKIVEVPLHFFVSLESYTFRRLINEHPKIKGLIGLYEPVENKYNLENIEMISSDFKFEFKKVFRPAQLKQICFKGILLLSEFSQCIEYFPNLKRLHINSFYHDIKKYDGPNLSTLKILEIPPGNLGTGFRIMDSCPCLESAFIYSGYFQSNIIDDSIKNFNLRDLVIEHPYTCEFTLELLRKICTKFPNLHHLGIRGYEVDDSHVELMVKLLPELKLIDLRKCKKVTQRPAHFLSQFCEKSDRSVKIFYDCEKEPLEWPKLDTTHELIVYGFDFMKNCFYKTWNSLPDLIDEDK
ncbi:uncharacterized protein LOC128388958 isoform X2 [Panonychus citri]|uniref:uncharacterized protein LOC128388958 isoform X2 n=1 Tax=Panonychus citri TaxID=50023 RepID=UPI002306DDDA|nr:uncharacterized protein LOC128388958 isoform X2 [Panonychus citri]